MVSLKVNILGMEKRNVVGVETRNAVEVERRNAAGVSPGLITRQLPEITTVCEFVPGQDQVKPSIVNLENTISIHSYIHIR